MALPSSQLNCHSESPTQSELESWASKAPLKLLASVLYAMPDRTGKPGAIREELETRVELTPKWSGWWNRVRPMLKTSEHFSVDKANRITLLHEIEDIPPEPLAPPSKPARPYREKPPSKTELEWLAWFRGELPTPPGGVPAESAMAAFSKCPADSVKPALERTMQAAAEFLKTSKTGKKSAAGWAQLLSRAALRWSEAASPLPDDGFAETIGNLLARLVKFAEFPRESARWLLQAGALPERQAEAWRLGFATGVWQAFDDPEKDLRNWCRSSFPQLRNQEKVSIAREMVLAAFSSDATSVRYRQLDDLLGFLPEDRVGILQELVVRSAYGKAARRRALDYITHATHAHRFIKPAELNLLVLATLLLADDPGRAGVSLAAQRLGEALENTTAYADDPVWNALLDDGRQRIANLHEQLERQRQSYESELERQRKERRSAEEQLNRQIQRLRTELDAGREQSKLDIRQDMLTVMSETLQSLRQSKDSPEQMLRQVEAGLALALRAGDAEEFGQVGDTVPYDSTQHQAGQHIPLNAVVRISYPGAVVRGKLTGDRVILKAQVVCPTEVN